jgi:hypothetical protein
MYAALIRAAERWRGIRISEFEQRQLKAIREEIDKDFAARNAPAATAPNRIYPATSGLDLSGGLKWQIRWEIYPCRKLSALESWPYNHPSPGKMLVQRMIAA